MFIITMEKETRQEKIDRETLEREEWVHNKRQEETEELRRYTER